MEELRADVREDIFSKTIAEQRQKTKIVIEPSFNAELEKNLRNNYNKNYRKSHRES